MKRKYFTYLFIKPPREKGEVVPSEEKTTINMIVIRDGKSDRCSYPYMPVLLGYKRVWGVIKAKVQTKALMEILETPISDWNGSWKELESWGCEITPLSSYAPKEQK